MNAAAVAKDTGLAIEVAFSERDPKGYLNGLTVEFEIDGVLNGRRTMTGMPLSLPRFASLSALARVHACVRLCYSSVVLVNMNTGA